MKKLVPLTILTSLLLWSSVALAICARTSVCITWPAVRTWTDGSTITADTAVSYQIFRVGTDGARLQTTALSAELQRQPAGQQCYYMVTIFTKNGVSYVSGPSEITADTCKLVRSAAPTDGSIEDAGARTIPPKK